MAAPVPAIDPTYCVRADSTSAWHTSSSLTEIETEVNTTRKICTLFCRQQCDDQQKSECQFGLHLAEQDRPVCWSWLYSTKCQRVGGLPCWFQHVIPESAKFKLSPHLFIQVHGSHEIRLIDILTEQFHSDVAHLQPVRFYGANRRQDRLLAVTLHKGGRQAAEAFVARVASYDMILRTVMRSYLVDGSCKQWDELMDSIGSCLRTQQEQGGFTVMQGHGQQGEYEPGTLFVRTQSYPNTLEEPLVHALEVLPGLRIQGVMSGWHARVCVAWVGGWYYWSIEKPDTPSVSSAAGDAYKQAEQLGKSMPSSICRAQSKLTEVLSRLPLLAKAMTEQQHTSEPRRAIDVGAAPGGWSYALATVCSYETVYAVDPAELNPGSLAMPQSVVHMRMRGNVAVKQLQQQHGLGAPCLHAMTCDMNTSSLVTLEMLREVGPLLVPGAAIVLTLKNFDGSAKKWRDRLHIAWKDFCSLCDSPQVLHLFANGPDEITVCGLWKGPQAIPVPVV